MGPGERAVAPERAPEPPGRAFPELRALTRGLNHSRRPAGTLLCAQPSASAPSRPPVSLPVDQQVLIL